MTVALIALIAAMQGGHPSPAPAPTAPALASAPTVTAPPEPAALPEIRYGAVIPGLLTVDATDAHTVATAQVHTLETSVQAFGMGHEQAVAVFPATDFLGTRTPVVAIRADGPWSLVLTPARSALPSHSLSGSAPAQTAAWVRTADLGEGRTLPTHIEVDRAARTLSIVDENGHVTRRARVAVGASATPTPGGVVGYIEARFSDPRQGSGDLPIQLLSLHSSELDEPMSGGQGGLIAIHYSAHRAGAITHGCIRADTQTVRAIDALPLGTLVLVR